MRPQIRVDVAADAQKNAESLTRPYITGAAPGERGRRLARESEKIAQCILRLVGFSHFPLHELGQDSDYPFR
jgi:hypothetical protein